MPVAAAAPPPEDNTPFKPVTAIADTLKAVSSARPPPSAMDPLEMKRLAAQEAEENRRREEKQREESEAAYQLYKQQEMEKRRAGGSTHGAPPRSEVERKTKLDTFTAAPTVAEFVPALQKKMSQRSGPGEAAPLPALWLPYLGSSSPAGAVDASSLPAPPAPPGGEQACTLLGNSRGPRCI